MSDLLFGKVRESQKNIILTLAELALTRMGSYSFSIVH